MGNLTVSKATQQWFEELLDPLYGLLSVRHKLDEHIIRAIVQKESGGHPYAVRVENGLLRQPWWNVAMKDLQLPVDDPRYRTSVGPMQVLTINCYHLWAEGEGRDTWQGDWEQLAFHPMINMNYACGILKAHVRKYLSIEKAVSAYNAGYPTQRNYKAYTKPVLDTAAKLRGRK